MFKKFLYIVAMISLLGAAGCSALSKTSTATTATTTTPSSVRLVRETQLASQWTMKQLEVNLETEIPIMLTMNNGDKAEGYFYVVKGNSVKFKISGSSLIYESKPATAKEKEITSDKFSFTASTAQGSGYTLLLSTANATANQKTDTVVFIELIYPKSDAIFVPFGTK